MFQTCVRIRVYASRVVPVGVWERKSSLAGTDTAARCDFQTRGHLGLKFRPSEMIPNGIKCTAVSYVILVKRGASGQVQSKT